MNHAPEPVTGALATFDGTEWYRIDGVDHMDPFLMTVSSNSDLWLFASSRGSLTAGRVDANGALLPYETEDRIHRNAGLSGPITVIARTVDGRRETWRPFGVDPDPRSRRAVAKATTGNRIFFEEHNEAWGITFRSTWSPADSHGWVRRTELIDTSGQGAELEIVDGLVDVMPSGLDSTFEQLMSNFADAYKRSETGRWGSAALYTLETLITDGTMPGEALAATLISSFGDTPATLHLDERVVAAMLRDEPWPTNHLLTGRRGSYLLRGTVTVPAEGSTQWSLVADAGLDHAAVAARVATAARPDIAEAIAADVQAGEQRLRTLLEGADGFHRTGDPIADAHHLSNTMSNAMRGGLFPFGTTVPIGSFLDHLARWNRPVHDRHRDAIASLGDVVPVATLHGFVDSTDDPDLIRLTLEYMPLAFSRRHGDPSRPWNRFSIRVRSETGEDVIGYQGNWRDIFQNWEATLMSYPDFASHAVAKFVNASTIDGNNPYRITQDGIDWEVPDPHDPWANMGYWGDHQIVYLHHLVTLWDRFDPGELDAWLERPVFTYADIPYVIADHEDMVKDPRSTISFDLARANEIEVREADLGSDGRLLASPTNEMVRVGLFEKLLVPALAKLTGYVPGGGIWMNTQRPEWNDANNALAGYGLSMVTLYYLHAYLQSLGDIIDRHPAGSISISATMTRWMREISEILGSHDPSSSASDDRSRRSFVDALGTTGERHRRRARYSFDTTTIAVDKDEVSRLVEVALGHLAHTIEHARRDDGLFQAYNLVAFPDDDSAAVSHLGPMLEGQVAVLSSGALSSEETLDVLEALFASGMYRADQDSFMLYPVKELPSFLDRNTVRSDDPRITGCVEALISGGIVVRDHSGDLHFTPTMTNGADLSAALEQSDVDDSARPGVLAVYEETFNHHAYTGRSGSMHAYEGIGSIFWHMVGKLLVAVQAAHRGAVESDASDEVIAGLADAYRRVRDGLSFRKDPATYGAIPTDWYSHSPSHAGAQQPWMTGTVKEGIIARFGELGLRVSGGQISMTTGLLDASDLVGPDGTGEFSYCGIPFEVRFGESPTTELLRSGEWQAATPGLTLSRDDSRAIFERSGSIEAVRLTLVGNGGSV